MIRTTPTHTSTTAAPRPARTVVKSRSSADFQKLMQPAAAPAVKLTAATTKTTTTDNVPHLGPFTGDPDLHPATPALRAPDPVTSSPYLPAGYKGDVDLMNKTEHERTMNDWLQNYTKWSNDQKTQIYQQALVNWQLNDQRCRELGIASPPKPTPPTLEEIKAMPAGYWFS